MWHLSSPTRNWTCVPCIGRRILNHCTTRQVLDGWLLWESTASFLLLPVHTHVRIIFFLLAFFKLMRGNNFGIFFFFLKRSEVWIYFSILVHFPLFFSVATTYLLLYISFRRHFQGPSFHSPQGLLQLWTGTQDHGVLTCLYQLLTMWPYYVTYPWQAD